MNKKSNTGWRFYLIAALIFIAFLFIKKNNVVHWIQSARNIDRQEETIRRYNESIEQMDSRLHGLENSLDTLETYARENFNFVKPGEDVYLLY
ncbi:MAG: septum formation initiator family protein [Bacteroidales bacterium]|nr:septum formation initiator family protein [Bacteroidales bacterium]